MLDKQQGQNSRRASLNAAQTSVTDEKDHRNFNLRDQMEKYQIQKFRDNKRTLVQNNQTIIEQQLLRKELKPEYSFTPSNYCSQHNLVPEIESSSQVKTNEKRLKGIQVFETPIKQINPALRKSEAIPKSAQVMNTQTNLKTINAISKLRKNQNKLYLDSQSTQNGERSPDLVKLRISNCNTFKAKENERYSQVSISKKSNEHNPYLIPNQSSVSLRPSTMQQHNRRSSLNLNQNLKTTKNSNQIHSQSSSKSTNKISFHKSQQSTQDSKRRNSMIQVYDDAKVENEIREQDQSQKNGQKVISKKCFESFLKEQRDFLERQKIGREFVQKQQIEDQIRPQIADRRSPLRKSKDQSGSPTRVQIHQRLFVEAQEKIIIKRESASKSGQRPQSARKFRSMKDQKSHLLKITKPLQQTLGERLESERKKTEEMSPPKIDENTDELIFRKIQYQAKDYFKIEQFTDQDHNYDASMWQFRDFMMHMNFLRQDFQVIQEQAVIQEIWNQRFKCNSNTDYTDIRNILIVIGGLLQLKTKKIIRSQIQFNKKEVSQKIFDYNSEKLIHFEDFNAVKNFHKKYKLLYDRHMIQRNIKNIQSKSFEFKPQLNQRTNKIALQTSRPSSKNIYQRLSSTERNKAKSPDTQKKNSDIADIYEGAFEKIIRQYKKPSEKKTQKEVQERKYILTSPQKHEKHKKESAGNKQENINADSELIMYYQPNLLSNQTIDSHQSKESEFDIYLKQTTNNTPPNAENQLKEDPIMYIDVNLGEKGLSPQKISSLTKFIVDKVNFHRQMYPQSKRRL
ncbi:UNKNOWN [Stylonychia lemnae]|uniref:Uncharacterized protein n=1 Tax=Stylonychia lemnae TaxID=5949 RepID=A0A078ASE4_STYLE|nr:UNKNOWN [Stylonychia lemnae]|eukprot:CDW84142.1 UNKNOWN [Stylonychia lemnae]